MKRPDGLIICDYHKRGGQLDWHGEVLDDGITIIPGYVEVSDGQVSELQSDDPNNKIEEAGVLKNRHKDQNGNDLITRKMIKRGDPYSVDNGDYHFCNKECYKNYYKSK